MNFSGRKVLKTQSKMKRSSHTNTHKQQRNALTHTHLAPAAAAQGQDNVEADVENARKAVERKLIYLSESNHMAGPSRALRRRAQRGAGEAGSCSGHRHKHAKRHVQDELIGRTRNKGGYNTLMMETSPRRNGLTPRDPQAELEMVTSMESAANIKMSRRMRDVVLEAEQQELRLGNTYGRSHLNSKPLSAYAQKRVPSYTCSFCGAKFHIKSLLGAHRRTHDDDFKIRCNGRRPRESTTTLIAGNLCKFCDRKFDLERTLHIHQLCHCKKITPQQRRKLGFTELDHEKKAPLPNFQRQAKESVYPTGPSVALGPNALKHQQMQIPQSQMMVLPEQQQKAISHAVAPPERWR